MTNLTYNWLREDGSPYYVGKDSSGQRAYRKGSPPRNRIRIQEWPDEATAFAFEIYQIDFWGRKDLGTGILRNLTDGGEGSGGATRSRETRKIMSEKMKVTMRTEEMRRKISGSLQGNRRALGTRHTDEWKESARLRLLENPISKSTEETTRRKISIAMLGKQNTLGLRHTEETKRKISASMRARVRG